MIETTAVAKSVGSFEANVQRLVNIMMQVYMAMVTGLPSQASKPHCHLSEMEGRCQCVFVHLGN